MELITSAILESFANEQRRKMQELLPELVKRLIVASCSDRSRLRIPDRDDIWVSGFDGVVFTESDTPYVSSGQSVWEFGASSDTLQKINDDYEKRTKNPIGIVPENSVFYLVTPKIWAYSVSIPEWEATHTGNWKSVRVYDASTLCDWINSEPIVCAWLLEKFYEKKDCDISTVSTAWKRFSNLTSPALSHTLFTQGRENISQTFFSQMQQKMCCVQADTFFDAVGFCLSMLLQNSEAANTVIVVYNKQTYRTLTENIQGKTFLLHFPFSGQVSDSNQTILCCSREATRRPGVIKLPSLWKTQFEKAMHDMGIGEPKISELYAFTHGADGIYPHEFICMILEEFSDSSLTKAVAISHLNAYGARVVLDGLYESQMAETMQQRANDMELNYPQTAKILRCIANDYASEAKRDRQYAEMGHFR